MRYTKRKLTSREKLTVLRLITERRIRMWGRFKISSLFAIIGTFVGIATFFFLGVLVQPAITPYISDYGSGDYFTYVLVGMAFMAYAGISLSMYSNIIRGSYWGNTLEIIMSSPLSFPSFFVMTALWTYFTATLGILLYLLLGVFVFGAGIAITSTFWLIIPLLVLSCIAISGFGLMSGSMFLLADVKGNVEPISWAVGVLSGLVSGVVFPPEIFLTVAPPLYHLSRIIPHTYAIDAFRRTVLNGEGLSNPMVQQDFIMLALFAMILFPLGLYMFARGIRKAERTGKLARWGG